MFRALTLLLFLPAAAGASSPEMVTIPAGQYVPQYGDKAEPVTVDAFQLDVYPVTNAAFLHFVTGQPKWQRSRVPALFADEAYLSHWEGDLSPGALASPSAPVTNVSWFAAKYYCAAEGKRLPSMDEWERAGHADVDTPVPEDLGVQYRRISDIDFAHSNMINVLGPDGVIAHQQIGLGISPDATVAAIEAL